ncbi:MAG: glycosyltransferase family 2 protein [Flavobacteriaceae bacterium]|jgi:glycosyltransferase involved in cell wall biosynthesis|nr:glycosyltransferase family 2 protein [Flavobacteriaceae bacterium]
MKCPLITISIPAYNSERYINRSIYSALNQTYPNLEIVIVDDKGKDKSLEISKKIQSQHPDKIRIIEHRENSGLSIVRNTGIDDARGEYLFFLDSDDEIPADCIEKLYNKAKETRATLTIGQTTAIDTFSHTEYPIFEFKKDRDYLEGNDAILEHFCKGEWAVSAWNKLFKVDFFRKNKIYFIKGLFSQDELWSFHTALKLDSIAFLNANTYLYYLHGDSIVFNKKKINFENHQTIVEYFTRAYKEESPLRKKFILNHIIRFKELTLTLQWKSMRVDGDYWKQNYSRLKKAPSLSVSDYLSSYFSKDLKKKNFFQNLPVELGYKLFEWRFGRGKK